MEHLHVVPPPEEDPRAAQLEILNEVARIATQDLELRPMLQRITDALAAKLGWQFEMKGKALEEANEHLANAIETLHRISTQDGLTGVSNRRHFDETLALEWRRAARNRAPLALLLVDIDHFKSFNDATGHQAGDDVLRRVAQTLRDSLNRAADVVARYGGEEFGILLPETDDEQAHRVAEALRQRVEFLGSVTISVGAASRVPPRDGLGFDDLVRAADEALYEAKRRGRNRVV